MDRRPFFAGEATSPTFFTTAHKVKIVGRRAAKEVLVEVGGQAQLDGTYHEQLYILGRIDDKLSVDCPRMKSHAPFASLGRIRSSSTENGAIQGRDGQPPWRYRADRHPV
ncbi:MAG: hypothetical protein EKK33_06860 [Bradyrhizobiaceae bacterium]|nr:MAG: hypothetical protein EKK33_06860 [Bradyrhizobiaceae bacterium]